MYATRPTNFASQEAFDRARADWFAREGLSPDGSKVGWDGESFKVPDPFQVSYDENGNKQFRFNAHTAFNGRQGGDYADPLRAERREMNEEGKEMFQFKTNILGAEAQKGRDHIRAMFNTKTMLQPWMMAVGAKLGGA